MTNQTLKPRIYVACLAAYNNGHLHGTWIEVGADAWEIWDEVNAMLKASPVAGAEEWAIHDYEGFGSVRIEEYISFDTVIELAAFLTEHGEVGAAVLAYYGQDLEEAREAMEDRYVGRYDSAADYVQEMTEECQSIPEPLRYYIDWQAMARDAKINGELLAIETGYHAVHVFSS